MRFTSMPRSRSSTGASSGFSSCETICSSDESDDDDCQVLGSRPPQTEAVSPTASRSSWSAWEIRSCGKRPKVGKTGNSYLGPDIVDDSQQNLRRQWEAATLRRRTCPPMRSEGSKAGTNGWESRPPQSAGFRRETDSSATLGGDSGTAETVQSNGNVDPVRAFSFQNLSESTSTSSDSVVQVTEVDTREHGSTEHDEVASGSRKSDVPEFPTDEYVFPPDDSVFPTEDYVFPEDDPVLPTDDPVLATDDSVFPTDDPVFATNDPVFAINDFVFATDDQVSHETSSNPVSGNGEDPFVSMNSCRASCSTEVRKSSKRPYAPETIPDADLKQFKPRSNATNVASTSGQVGTTSFKHMDIHNQSVRDSGAFEPVFDFPMGQDLVGAREKLKETADFKLADEKEWANRQQELQKQAQEARRLRERKRAETDRKNEVELRQKQRLEEIRQTQLREERNMGLKDQLRGKVQSDLERMASECRDMTSLLRRLQIPVEGGTCPSLQQVNAAYKKALLRFHPDRTSATAHGDPQRQVEAEETFKLITRMKPILKPTSIFTAMTAK